MSVLHPSHPLRRPRRWRRAPVLCGVAMVLCAATAASPALATEDPIPPDLTDPTPAGGLATCFGQFVDTWVPPGGAPFYAGNGDDVIMGTSGPDVIYGEGGIDRICQPQSDHASGLIILNPGAGDGIDVIHGDGGGDFVDGGTDRDQIYGDAGADVLHGGDQSDVVDGGADNDTVHGNDGGDGLACGTTGVDVDVAYGGAGVDFLVPSPPQADCETYVQ